MRNDIDTSKRMTYEEAVARARALAPAIAARAAAAEVQRHQPEETIREIVEAGLVRLLTPARWGGHELGLDAFVNSAIEVARVDGSAGWCYSLFIMHNWMLGHFPEEAQNDVWANDPDVLITTSFIPAGRVTCIEGGYRLSGNWPWASGVDHSSWCMLGGLLSSSEDEQPEICLFLVPENDYAILDTWFVAGQKATGSKNVEVKDAFVPEHRIIRLRQLREGITPGTAVNTGPLYRLPFFVVSIPSLIAPILGATIGAYETWRDLSRNKITTAGREQIAMFSHVQIRLAEIEAEIQAARSFLQHNLDLVASGPSISFEQRLRYSRDCTYIARLCVRAMEQIFLASGGSANYETNPLQRYWRDIHAMGAHVDLNFDTAAEAFGRMELGLPPGPHHNSF